MAAFLDNCRFNVSTSGTSDHVYVSAFLGSQSPDKAGAVNGRAYKFLAISADQLQWEIAEGVYTSGTGTFARTTVLYNSSGTGTAAGQSGAGTKIAFSASPTVAIIGVKEDLIAIEEANAFTAAQKAQARTNIGAVLRGQIAGLTLSTAGGSTSFGIAAGEAADSTAVDLMVLASAMTKTTVNWAIGSGNGGMMPGALAGLSWYNVWLIKRPDTGVVDVVTDLVTNGSTNISSLASGAYTEFRRIGCMKTNGSNQWVKFSQLGDKFLWDVPTQDDTSSVGTTAALITLNVPTGIQVDAEIFGLATNTAAGTVWAITSPDQTDTLPTGTFFSGITGAPSVNVTYSQIVRTNTSGQVRKRAGAATTTIYINTFGWTDRRGRDN